MPNWWDNPNFKGGVTSGSDGSGIITSTSTTTPAYSRVTSLPSFMPKMGDITSELADQYSKTPSMFDTSEFDAASQGNQSRVLTTALNAGNNAATEYANRARQAGGSGLGAGLVKAEAGVGARATAGDMELKRLQFDAQQREKAASQATQIASTLATLRDSYLKSLVGYATSEDATSAEFKSKMAAVDSTNRATNEQAREFNFKMPTTGGYQSNVLGNISNLYGTPFRDPTTGMPSSNVQFAPTHRGG